MATHLPSIDDSTVHSVIATATNRRQASKLLDIRTSNALICRRHSGIDVWILKCDLGMHAIWTRLGTYCDDRHIDLPILIDVIDGADDIDIEQNPNNSIRRIAWCEEEDDG